MAHTHTDSTGEALMEQIQVADMQWPSLVINGTFTEVLHEHRAYMESLGFRVATPAALGLGVPAEIMRASREYDAVFGPGLPYDAGFFADPGRLRVISVAASGYEGIDVDAATQAGVAVINAPTPLGSAVVADLAFGLLLALARQIPQCHRRITEASPEQRTYAHQPRPIGTLVWGKTLGILGLGAIGKEMARRGTGFGMRVLAVDPSWDAAFAAAHGIERVALSMLLAESDFFSLHLRDTPATRGIIGTAELARMKPTAFLVNTARAGLVDQDALYAALTAGRLSGAALDTAIDHSVNPLIDLPNVISTPHLGNRCHEGIFEVMRTAIENAAAVLRGQKPPYLINPDVSLRLYGKA